MLSIITTFYWFYRFCQDDKSKTKNEIHRFSLMLSFHLTMRLFPLDFQFMQKGIDREW